MISQTSAKIEPQMLKDQGNAMLGISTNEDVLPINIIIKNATDLKNVAHLNPIQALALILISLALTVLGGSIPAKIAAKKDPVEALRSE